MGGLVGNKFISFLLKKMKKRKYLQHMAWGEWGLDGEKGNWICVVERGRRGACRIECMRRKKEKGSKGERGKKREERRTLRP